MIFSKSLRTYGVQDAGVGTIREQDLHGFYVAVLCGQHQWSAAILFDKIETLSLIFQMFPFYFSLTLTNEQSSKSHVLLTVVQTSLGFFPASRNRRIPSM